MDRMSPQRQDIVDLYCCVAVMDTRGTIEKTVNLSIKRLWSQLQFIIANTVFPQINLIWLVGGSKSDLIGLKPVFLSF